jgi:NAD(P)-dependent dehydrogenase (short-subunit alcohol dehydrogenase family)
VPESLEGRVALVTGGGSGVGANVARGLADAGMDVWVTGRTEARIKAVAALIGGHGCPATSPKRTTSRAGLSRRLRSTCSSTTRACKARW